MKAFPIGLALLAALALAPGCTRDIGDDCQTSVDCDPNGTRACDLSQPGGYCTIQGCNETSCPSGSACIRLFPVMFLDPGKVCDSDCEDLVCRTGPCGETDPATCLPVCPDKCLATPNGINLLNACAADELCLDQTVKGQPQDLCVRRSLEQRYCAKNCGNDGDCRSNYQCRLTGSGDGSLGLSATPGATTHYCAPALPP